MTEKDLEIINQFARTPLKEEDIYTFDFILCDNEVDRDMERFSNNALENIAKIFVGITGIFDHDSKSSNQSARIFKAECITKEDTKTSLGMAYKFVKATAYMVRTPKNQDLIAEIEGGIKKEVSIGCRVDKKICSICQKEVTKHCGHKLGKVYKNSTCHHILDEVGDAYEWSFVAVPAQKNAGVTKQFSTMNKKAIRKLYEEKGQPLEAYELTLLGQKQLNLIKREVYQAIFPACTTKKAKILGNALDKLGYEELTALRDVVAKEKTKDCWGSQFASLKSIKGKENASFKI